MPGRPRLMFYGSCGKSRATLYVRVNLFCIDFHRTDAEPPGKDAPPGRPRGETTSRTAPTPYVVVVAALPAADAVVEELTPPTRPATSRPPTCVPFTIPPGHLARRPTTEPAGGTGRVASGPQLSRRGDLDQPGWRGPPSRVFLREALAPARKGPHGNAPGPPLPPVPGQNCRGRGPEGERGPAFRCQQGHGSASAAPSWCTALTNW
ncbi:hypothetical protein MTO96_045612 [Rhipicephalus appendiculatus]